MVPERDLEDVKVGNPVHLKMNSYPSRDFSGTVDDIEPSAELMDGQPMVMVHASLANKAGLLKPNLTGVAWIYCGQRRVIEIMSYRLVRWIRTEFWKLSP
jgi:multidrug resistance efflux pump